MYFEWSFGEMRHCAYEIQQRLTCIWIYVCHFLCQDVIHVTYRFMLACFASTQHSHPPPVLMSSHPEIWLVSCLHPLRIHLCKFFHPCTCMWWDLGQRAEDKYISLCFWFFSRTVICIKTHENRSTHSALKGLVWSWLACCSNPWPR